VAPEGGALCSPDDYLKPPAVVLLEAPGPGQQVGLAPGPGVGARTPLAAAVNTPAAAGAPQQPTHPHPPSCRTKTGCSWIPWTPCTSRSAPQQATPAAGTRLWAPAARMAAPSGARSAAPTPGPAGTLRQAAAACSHLPRQQPPRLPAPARRSAGAAKRKRAPPASGALPPRPPPAARCADRPPCSWRPPSCTAHPRPANSWPRCRPQLQARRRSPRPLHRGSNSSS
jgi:hypothetical protein